LEPQLVALDPGLRLKMFVDSAPVMERDLAVRAGLGWIGKNGLLLHPQHGSQFFIGGFFLNRTLEKKLVAPRESCGTCRRCIDACPTSAIEETRQVNAARCISYLTIEKKGEIDEELRRKIGNRIFGCDACQQVCPWNGKLLVDAPPAGSKFNRPLEDWLKILQPGGGFKRLFKETPVYRAGRQGMLRNVEIALNNRSENPRRG
jgi:epoxyqueuosine reductase